MVAQTLMTIMITTVLKNLATIKKNIAKPLFCIFVLITFTAHEALAQTSKPDNTTTKSQNTQTAKKTAQKTTNKPVNKTTAAPKTTAAKPATSTKSVASTKKISAPVKSVAVKKVSPSKPTPTPIAATQKATPTKPAPTKSMVIKPAAATVLTIDNQRFTVPAQTTAPVPQPNYKTNEDFVNEFESYVETKIVPRVPGVALAVIANGKVKVLQAYGVKKVNGNDPINTDTLFRLASVSKTIGSTAGALLVRDGLVSWDTPVTTVLPDVEFKDPRYGNQLTIRNILSQSTGLPTHTNDNYIEEGLPFDEVVRRLRYVNFVCPPGKCYAYQNVTYSLISNIIQKKTGKTYEQYVQEKVFNPLGMHTASFGMLGLKANNNYALPHVMTRSGWYTETITENYYRINPAAGANASITDMSHWVLAQMGHNPEVLSPSTLNTLHDKVTKNTPSQSHYGTREGVTDTHYGLGWRIFDYRGDKNFVHHGGYVLGFRSEMVFNPDLQIGMVILSNSNKLAGDVIFKFLDAYEDDKRGMKISKR